MVKTAKSPCISAGALVLVEAAGIEPASANPLPKDLHV